MDDVYGCCAVWRGGVWGWVVVGAEEMEMMNKENSISEGARLMRTIFHKYGISISMKSATIMADIMRDAGFIKRSDIQPCEVCERITDANKDIFWTFARTHQPEDKDEFHSVPARFCPVCGRKIDKERKMEPWEEKENRS